MGNSYENPAWTSAETWWLMHRADAELFIDNLPVVEHTFMIPNTGEKTFIYALLLRLRKWKTRTVLDECVMFTDWSDGCNTWSDHAALCDCPHPAQEKFRQANEGTPRTYATVGEKAWEDLRCSPFWWGRKFEDHATRMDN